MMDNTAAYVDTHCHLDFADFLDDRDAVVENALRQGVQAMVNVGSSLSGSEDAVALSCRYGCVFASVGIHPHDASAYNAGARNRLAELGRREKVVAVGEIGLDYYRMLAPKSAQRAAFEGQLGLAQELGLPVIIHTRQADTDTLEILASRRPVRAVVHCFSGDTHFLGRCLEAGLFISFTANITYAGAGALREVVAAAPLERIMLETDAPFLAPQGMRGRRNDPSAVIRVAEEIASVQKRDLAEVAQMTTRTARAFFNL